MGALSGHVPHGWSWGFLAGWSFPPCSNTQNPHFHTLNALYLHQSIKSSSNTYTTSAPRGSLFRQSTCTPSVSVVCRPRQYRQIHEGIPSFMCYFAFYFTFTVVFAIYFTFTVFLACNFTFAVVFACNFDFAAAFYSSHWWVPFVLHVVRICAYLFQKFRFFT